MRLTAKKWLIATGIAAAITMLMPSLVMVAAISIIGLPIALALYVAPLVFLFSLGTWLVGRRLNLGTAGYFIGAGVTLIALMLPPWFVNTRLEERAAALIAEDTDKVSKPLRAKIIAVRSDKPVSANRDEAACDGLCMRALLNGVAERVLVARHAATEPPDATAQAVSFRFEKRAECPQVKLPESNDDIKEDGKRRPYDKKFARELMQLEIASGNCLIEETVPLGIADVVLSRGAVHRGTSTIGAGLDLAADTLTASRVSVHERDATGFREVYRRTGVVTHLLLPVLMPTIEGGQELRTYAVFARYADLKNTPSAYESEPDWSAFLTGTLGFDLALRDDTADETARKVLKAGIANTGLISDSVVKLGADFIDGINRRRAMVGEDYPLARSVLTDKRFSVPRGASAAISHAREAPDGYFEAIATSMFLRLASIADTDEGHRHPVWRDEARHIAEVVRELPTATILKHRADFDWLAKQERLRVWTYRALVRFQDFGGEAAPTLLWLMDEGVRLKHSYGSDWNNIYIAGLTGLCRMGEAGRAMIQPIYERLSSGAMVKHASYWDLTIQTLVGMGADPDAMWGHLQTDDRNHTHQRFMFEVTRAQKNRECWY